MTESLLGKRNKEIMGIYDRIISSTSVNLKYASRDTILDLVMEHSAPRFYITPKMAERYVLGFKRQSDSIIRSRKIDMIEDLMEAYERAIVRYKNSSRAMLWEHIVNTPAKSFYVSKKRLAEIIFKYKGRNGR